MIVRMDTKIKIEIRTYDNFFRFSFDNVNLHVNIHP